MSYIYHQPHPVTLESGAVLPEVDIVYDTFGEMNAARDNIIWRRLQHYMGVPRPDG